MLSSSVVLRLQHLPRGGRGGHDDGRHLAEADEHDGAVRRRERTQRPVREAAELVEVADEREPLWGRRRRAVGGIGDRFLAAAVK